MASPSRINGLILTVSAVVATALTKRVTEVIWTAATGKPALERADDPDNDIRDALAFGLISGAAAGVIRTMVNRKARAFMARPPATG